MKKRLEENICTLPFNNLHFFYDGRVFVCCWSTSKSIGNIHDNSLKELWNNKDINEFRESVLNGDYSFCQTQFCPLINDMKSHGIRFVNKKSFNREYVTNDEFNVYSGHVSEVPWGPREITIGHSRSCNLKCPTCRKDYIKESNKEDEENFQKILNEFEQLPETIHFSTAGDPFHNKYLYKWLTSVDKTKLESNKCFNIYTNALLLNKESWGAVSQAIKDKNITLYISIDGATKDTYNKNRVGSDWDILVENLDFINSCSDFDKIVFRYVVQNNNFREMKQFVEFSNQYNVTVEFLQIENWGTFTQADFIERNVFSYLNENHAEFGKILKDDIFKQKNIILPPFKDYSHIKINDGYGFTIFNSNPYSRVINHDSFFTSNDLTTKIVYSNEPTGDQCEITLGKDEWAGCGYYFNEKELLDISEYSVLQMRCKTKDDAIGKITVLLKDNVDEKCVLLSDYNFIGNNRWQTIKIPLHDFISKGLDPKNISIPFMIKFENFSENSSMLIDSLCIC